MKNRTLTLNLNLFTVAIVLDPFFGALGGVVGGAASSHPSLLLGLIGLAAGIAVYCACLSVGMLGLRLEKWKTLCAFLSVVGVFLLISSPFWAFLLGKFLAGKI